MHQMNYQVVNFENGLKPLAAAAAWTHQVIISAHGRVSAEFVSSNFRIIKISPKPPIKDSLFVLGLLFLSIRAS